MNIGVKISAFAATLAVVFGAAYGIGSGVNPVSTEPEVGAHGAGHGESEGGGGDGGHDGGDDGDDHDDAAPAGGLQISDQGYTLDLRTANVEADEKSELSFRVLDADGEPVTEYREEHGKDLHLIVASRDLATYRHVHPTLAADGTWKVDLNLPSAGDYRVFADFTPDDADEGEDAPSLTLGADLAASGDYEPAELPAESRTVDVGDGYSVKLNGDLKPDKSSPLTLEVSKDGKPVTNLSPYLGAYGHLVALRAGDLAYLHVHPDGEPGDGKTKPGPKVTFNATAPSVGAYRLFLDFKHEGEVRTAEFTVAAEGTPGADEASGGSDSDEGGADGGDGHEH